MIGKDPFADENQAFAEKTVETEPIFTGKIISLQRDTVLLPNGKQAYREVVKHPGAVAVMVIQDDKMAVVEQYRKPLERSLVEIPAGKLDEGETPESAAMRELQEETGMKADHVTLVKSFYTSPGFADEIIHLYFADQCTKGEQQPDEDEFLQLQWLTLNEAKAFVEQGKIRDAKTVTAIYVWELYQLTGKLM
ncbi:NUDIX hydrolase [Marinicrinis sediminis]|uniref:NUDIX hydrolase n=1 Tax=Marinicrinis sediminis TaxID=1652465 RepID=A0ABW5RFM2_9BACL